MSTTQAVCQYDGPALVVLSLPVNLYKTLRICHEGAGSYDVKPTRKYPAVPIAIARTSSHRLDAA